MISTKIDRIIFFCCVHVTPVGAQGEEHRRRHTGGLTQEASHRRRHTRADTQEASHRRHVKQTPIIVCDTRIKSANINWTLRRRYTNHQCTPTNGVHQQGGSTNQGGPPNKGGPTNKGGPRTHGVHSEIKLAEKQPRRTHGNQDMLFSRGFIAVLFKLNVTNRFWMRLVGSSKYGMCGMYGMYSMYEPYGNCGNQYTIKNTYSL